MPSPSARCARRLNKWRLASPRLPSPRLPSPPLASPRLGSAPHQPTRLGLPRGFRARLHTPGSAAPAVEQPRAAPRRPPHPTQATRELSNLRFQPIGVDAACAGGARPGSGPGAGDGRNAAVEALPACCASLLRSLPSVQTRTPSLRRCRWQIHTLTCEIL